MSSVHANVATSVDINDVVDQAKFNNYHVKVMLLCGLLLIFDGYDLFILGSVLPTLMAEWQLTPIQAGALGTYALFGMMFGALGFGSLADRIGRKRGVIICFALFSVATCLTGFAKDTTQFGILRFLAGLGCGGLMPNAVALMNEYAPRRSRSFLVALMFSGYSLGGVLCAGLAIYVIPAYGWEMMFFLAAVPLILVPVLVKSLPESIGFMLRTGETEKARQTLQQLNPAAGITATTELTQKTVKASGVPALDLFRENRTLGTLMLWLAFFCCLLMVYALGSWVPKLMNQAGYGLSSSLSFLLTLNFGGVVGAILGGWLGDRFGIARVLAWMFALGAVSIGLLGFESPVVVLYLLLTIAGACTIGSQILLYATGAQFYPLHMRSTGLGWASGIGRFGAISGPMLGGILLAQEYGITSNFLAFAFPGVVATIATMLFILATRNRSNESAVAAS